MKGLLRIALAAFFMTMAAISYAGTAANIVTPSLAPVLSKVLPAIVNIRVQLPSSEMAANRLKDNDDSSDNSADDSPPPGKLFSALASGVILNAEKGYIITNAHVISDAEPGTIIVTLGDGHHYTAKLIGADKPSDIALLQIRAPHLTAVKMANSNNLKIGDFVAAIGNPFGLNQTVTSGIVSGLGRTTLGIEGFEDFIQTDASINPGNSGGALINLQGQLVGINTAILAPSRGSIGIGFAIPVNMVKSVMAQLIAYGNVQRGILGVFAQDITPELASAFNTPDTKGAIVSGVMPNSPAEKAGIKVGDIIRRVNNEKMKNANDVVNILGFLRVESFVTLEVLRQKKLLKLTAVLSDPKDREEQNQAQDPLYGVDFAAVPGYTTEHGYINGVSVISVKENKEAWRSDLHPGDIIVSANQIPITSIEQLRKISRANVSRPLLLNVLRGHGAVFLVINKEES